MEISELTIKLIIILIPGAIASKIYQRLTTKNKFSPFELFVNSVMLGGLSYLTTSFFVDICNSSNTLIEFWNNLPSKKIPYKDVLLACITSVFLGIVISAIDNYKVLNKVAKFLRVTKKYGDENLFLYFLNADNVEEVYVRDKNSGFTYHGIIDSYSENNNYHEIVLRQVMVHDYETSASLYELDKIYICKNKNELTIELPFINLKHKEDE
jgi:hypothetical protein